MDREGTAQVREPDFSLLTGVFCSCVPVHTAIILSGPVFYNSEGLVRHWVHSLSATQVPFPRLGASLVPWAQPQPCTHGKLLPCWKGTSFSFPFSPALL